MYVSAAVSAFIFKSTTTLETKALMKEDFTLGGLYSKNLAEL